MSYAEQFIQGIQFRSRFDTDFSLDEASSRILERTFVQTSEKAMEEPFFGIRQRVCSLAQSYAAEQIAKPYSYQCLADSHTFLNACIDQKILDERYMTLTVGDISIKSEKLFNTSRQTIEEAITNGISTVDAPRFHVWLTLVDMTVIDLTIVQQLVKLQKMTQPDDPMRWLNVWRPERKGVFDYHPLLSDDNFLSRLQRKAH